MEREFRAVLRPGDAPPDAPSERSCGGCTLCCTVLRVDELGKLGGTPCAKLRADAGGCGIYQSRPSICRRYRCLWLQGAFQEADRPDRIGAVLDLLTRAGTTHLAVREAAPGALDRSERLGAIAGRYRAFMPVHVTDAHDVMNPDAPVRVLLPDGVEQRIEGEWVTTLRSGCPAERRRLSWFQRRVRQLLQWLRAARLRWVSGRSPE